MTQDTPSAVRTGEYSTPQMFGKHFDFSGKAINAKPWRTVEERLMLKHERSPQFPGSCLSSAGSVEQMGYLPQGASNRARGLSQSWTLKVMNDKVLTLLTGKDDAAS